MHRYQSREPLIFRGGYYPRKRTFKTHPKHVCFRWWVNRPQICGFFFSMFFLDLSIMFYPIFLKVAKNTPFFTQFCTFCTAKRCTRVHRRGPCPQFHDFYDDYMHFYMKVSPPPYRLIKLVHVLILFAKNEQSN